MAFEDGLFHLHVSWISRADGRDVVAAAAYRSGSRLKNDRKGSASDFSHKAARTLYSAILAPPGSPDWASDRLCLWNAVEAVEKRKDARLATEIEFAIPYGVPRNEWERLAHAMAALYAEQGHVVDFSLHLGEDGTNPHVHMLLPMRRLTEDGFAATKNREMDKRSFIEKARKNWQHVANHWLTQSGSRERIDHRSYRARGIDRERGRHWRPDPDERARKRMISHNMRQELTMSREPTMDERFRYPHLTQREDWPPKRLYPEPDMSAAERQELLAYRDSLSLERKEQTTPERPDRRAREEFLRELDSNIKHERTARKEPVDRDERSEPSVTDFTREQNMHEMQNQYRAEQRNREEQAALRQRALEQLFHTREESERLKVAKLQGRDELEREKERIVQDRMARIEAEDRERITRKHERQHEQFLRDMRDRDDDRTR